MANLSGYILTDAGKHLLAAANAGSCAIQITKVKLGEDAINSVNDLLDKTDLIGTNLKLIGISGAVATKNVCTVQAVITNANQDTNFTIRQVGVFAKGVAATNPPDGVTAADVPETLYAVAYDTLPDIIPAQNSAVVITRQFDINLAIENTSSIKVVVSPDGLVTVEILNKAIEEHNKDTNAHPGIFVAILGAVMKGILYLVDPADDSNDNQGATTGWVRRMFKTLLTAALNASGVQYNLAQNGFIKFGDYLGGFCIQWGRDRLIYGQQQIFLPIVVNTIKAILALDCDAGCDPLGAAPYTNRSFMIWNKNIPMGGGDQSDVQWFAICN